MGELAYDDMIPPIAGYFEALNQVAKDFEDALPIVGGNILIHVIDCASVMIVTRGRRVGMHTDLTDDPVHFTLAVEEWLLLELLDPESDVDLDAAVADGYLLMQGDYDVYERFMALADRRSMLDIRSAA